MAMSPFVDFHLGLDGTAEIDANHGDI